MSRIAKLFAYMTAAHRKAMFTVGKEADNDSFALKFKLYKGLLDPGIGYTYNYLRTCRNILFTIGKDNFIKYLK